MENGFNLRHWTRAVGFGDGSDRLQIAVLNWRNLNKNGSSEPRFPTMSKRCKGLSNEV